MSLKIDLYANDGSPLNVSPPMIYGRGVGGAELSMMTWAETMAARGHQVRVYNNPPEADRTDPRSSVYHGEVEYLPQIAFEPGENRDLFVIYRSPNKFIQLAKAAMKIHWSTDQMTVGNYATDIVPYVDKIICISPYHMTDYQGRYNPPGDKITCIDLGVRLQDYPAQIEKMPYRFIFCSVPERGLKIIRQIWPHIKNAIPEATLIITADHTLWGAPNPRNTNYRLDLLDCDGIVFKGAIPRHDLAVFQAEAQIHLYPCVYPELFCISSAECQAVGAYSVTSDMGALETTNEYGLIVPGDPFDPTWQRDYIATVLDLMADQKALTKKALQGAKLARRRFSWDRICDEWEAVING